MDKKSFDSITDCFVSYCIVNGECCMWFYSTLSRGDFYLMWSNILCPLLFSFLMLTLRFRGIMAKTLNVFKKSWKTFFIIFFSLCFLHHHDDALKYVFLNFFLHLTKMAWSLLQLSETRYCLFREIKNQLKNS